MGKTKKMWVVTTGKDKKPRFHRFNNGSCPTCGLTECLPDHPHGPGKFYHADLRRFLTFDEIEANQANGSSHLSPGLPKGLRSLGAYERHLEQKEEDRKRKIRERVQRHRKRKRLEGGQDVTLGNPQTLER